MGEHHHHPTLTRRGLLKAAGAGALLATVPLGALADPLQMPSATTGTGASRSSRLFRGTALTHGDLHNHSHLSDGTGSPELVYESIRAAGMDFAALTDHSTFSWGAIGAVDPCPHTQPYEHGESQECQSLAGMDEVAWEQVRQLADAANRDGSFAAIRGFEWSSPFLGHVNVWFSERWIDPLHTAGIGPEGIGQHLHQNAGPLGEALQPPADALLRANPLRTGMAPFYAWMNAAPSTPGLGGGLDGLAGFNHPGREQGRFSYFAYDPRMAERLVSIEIFNRGEDYLFEGFGDGQPSPLVECLNAGWRVGIIGVTDEHGTNWGFNPGKGRAGLWVRQLTREGVREALAQRRMFATREDGLRLDAAANGRRMGGGAGPARGPDRSLVRFEVDIERGPDHYGMPIEIQVLRPGTMFPEVVHVEPATLRRPDEPVIAFDVPLDPDGGDWVLLRVTDPARPNAQPGPAGHPCNNYALAYSSPWWLR